MPAVIRPQKGGRGGARGRGPAKAAQATYAPSKLRGASAVGLDPRTAVWAAGGLIGLAVIAAMAIGGRGTIARGVGNIADRAGVVMGFRLNSLTIKGGDALSTPAIAAATALHKGDPILGLDLERVREQVEAVGWVKSAKVVRLLPDTLVVSVQPRSLLAVWQHGDAADVVDVNGQVIPEATAVGFPQLPLVVGEGANEAAASLLPLVAARPRLMAQVDAFQRVDGRRWRLKLKDGGVIDLPAEGEEGALIAFDQLDARLHCLDLGFDRIDLRDPSATEVRMKGASPVAQQAALGGAAVQGL